MAFAALLAMFAVVLASAHAKARHTLETGFLGKPRIGAAMTDALFETTSADAQQNYAKLYGAARLSDATLTAAARKSKYSDLLILDAHGRVLATSAGTPAAVRHEAEAMPDYVRAALAGEPFVMTDVKTLGRKSAIQYVQHFPTAFGQRVIVAGFEPQLLSGLIAGYLSGTLTTPESRAFVLDGNGVPIAIANHDSKAPAPNAAATLERAIRTRAEGPLPGGIFFSAARVRHTPWRVISTISQARLFASVSGTSVWLPWLLFGAFALVLALVLVLVGRVLRGVSIQRRKDDELRAMAAERLGLAAITETMAEGVVVCRTSDRSIVYTNPSFDAMLGYEPAELLGSPLERIKPGARNSHLNGEVAQAMEASGRWCGELQVARKDGALLWCLSNMSMLEHPEHGPVWILVNSDITERKRIEAELEQATERAIEASRSKSQFVANMSHEIRTPLNGVIGMTQLLRDTELGPVQREYIDALATSGEALLAVISDVLDFSKIEAGHLELDCTNFDLRKTVEESCEILAEPAHGKGLEINLWIDPDAPAAVNGDRGRLRQVLLNLISNAVKFTDEGEVSVRVQREGPRLLRFEVSDTGVGVDAEQAPRLFEAFVQADQSTTRQFGGTGLGLAISTQLVRLMGGQIGVHPREGKGSTFWFTASLPKVDSAAERPRPRPELTGVRALIVDDNATNRTILYHYLRHWGLECETVDGAARALQLQEQAAREDRPFQLALLDFNMPRMSGLELAHQIRARASETETKIIVLSSSPLERKPFDGAGVSAFLTKPVRQSELHNRIVEALLDVPAAAPEPASEPIAKLRGAVVLVAEDNEINLTLARALLHRRGLKTEVARDGMQAVEMARAQRYAAILMDCQMPVIDGYEATRRIRATENGRRVPIIAMTAHSMAGDRERCLAAGMDDYMPKPIRNEHLDDVIQRWLPREAFTQDEAAPAANGDGSAGNGDGASTGNGDTALDHSTIMQLKDTLNGEMRGRLLETFESQVDSCVEEIAVAMRRGDDDERRRLAHLLKGSSATIGAKRLREVCQRLERTGRSQDPILGEGELAQLRANADEARRELKQQLL